MNLIYNILPIYLLLDVCIYSFSHVDIPRAGGYPRYPDPAPALQRDHNYQSYDSYSSQEVMMRETPRRARKNRRRFEYSDSEGNNKCKCSCTKCQQQKPKPCCEEFCATECTMQNNIIVVPYPVPFLVFNQSTQEFPTPPLPTTDSTSTTTTTPEPTTITTTTTPEPTTPEPTTTTTPATRRPFLVSQSTVPLFDPRPYKRYKIIGENNMRRNNMGQNMLRSQSFGRLPKYGIVPIPENLALSLMQQIKKDQNNDQYRKRLALDRNLLDYTRRGIAF